MANEPEEEQADWIIDAQGFYIATRAFLIRRGYCCANQCRNCPYVNWRDSPTWRPLPAEAVRAARVSPRVREGIERALARSVQQSQATGPLAETSALEIQTHYHLLLEVWRDEHQ